MRENEGVAARILLDFDADSEKIRNEVIRMLPGPSEEVTSGQIPFASHAKEVRNLREVWRRYKSDGDQGARERLVAAYSPLVGYVAGRTGAGLPVHVEEGDLVSYGLTGLISAIERFDPAGRSNSRPMPLRASGARSSTSCVRWTGSRVAFARSRGK